MASSSNQYDPAKVSQFDTEADFDRHDPITPNSALASPPSVTSTALNDYHDPISPTKPPAMLFVCRESRVEALKSYELTFGCANPQIQSMIYFNFDIDTLYFEYKETESFATTLSKFECDRLPYHDFDLKSKKTRVVYYQAKRIGANKVQRIGLSLRVYWRKWIYGHIRELRKDFGALKEVIMALNRDCVGDARFDLSNDARLEELQEDPDVAATGKVI